MKASFVSTLCCPACRGDLTLADAQSQGDEIETGRLSCAPCHREYQIRGSIPRFVDEGYAGSFGYQWNRFRKSQLDSHSGLTISRDRFLRQTGWNASTLQGAPVLDVGCGAGRFAEIALSLGAEVVAVDTSSAIDACWQNLRAQGILHCVQADIYALPFREQSFPFVYCFGVLQHTPDVRAAFLALARQVDSGGRLAADVYPLQKFEGLWPKHWIRPFTRKLAPKTTFTLVERMVKVLLPLSRRLGRIPGVGRKLRHLVPVANYEGVYPLSDAQLYEWSLLDTFDMLSPYYDQPQTAETLRRWTAEAGLDAADVVHDGLIVARAQRP